MKVTPGWRQRLSDARLIAHVGNIHRENGARDPLASQVQESNTRRDLSEVFRIRDILFRGLG